MGKSDCLIFKQNLCFAKIRVNGEFLGPKMQKYKNFTKSINEIYPKFYGITGIEKEVKEMFLFFKLTRIMPTELLWRFV